MRDNRAFKTWTKEELEYLEESWGRTSIPTIANNLNRSINAVRVKADRLKLGAVLESGDYVTFNQLIQAVTGSSSYSYKIKSWVENRGFPIRTKRVAQCTFRIVYIDEFWKWAEENKSFIDFSKMEVNILGREPEWVAEQRRKDFKVCSLQRKDPWSNAEDERLKYLLKQRKYGYAEISKMLKRSEGAIQRRCTDLKIKDRPVKADNHGANAEWTDEMYDALCEGIKNGDSYAYIASQIGKSEKAVRGKVYVKYLTENADKVRKMLGDDKWGDNAPVPKIRQAVTLSGHRTDSKKSLSVLAAVLKYRLNELGYAPYWQRHVCIKWDDIKGCTANCENCDECTVFERIKPQYCVRCGKTFYERSENKMCGDCRTARKKQAQRKWYKLNKKKNYPQKIDTADNSKNKD